MTEYYYTVTKGQTTQLIQLYKHDYGYRKRRNLEMAMVDGHTHTHTHTHTEAFGKMKPEDPKYKVKCAT